MRKEAETILGLKSIRRNRGITLEQIADSTKISVRSLEAIERGDFRKLPGGIYNTSYIRQYARAIDYDEAVLLAFYHRQMAPAANSASADGKPAVGSLRTVSTLFGS
jgi:cytoskeletal protein RodZ